MKHKIASYTIGAVGENALLAAGLLADELFRRTGIEFAVSDVGAIQITEDKTKAPAPEGFVFSSRNGEVRLTGYDKRGCIYAVGKLLRESRWYAGGLEISDMELSEYPKKPLRGHQIGYRNKTNAYSAWDMDTYYQYIREMALMGANSVEFMPDRTDDEDTAPCMKYNTHEVLVNTSRYSHEVGLDVWVWFPNSMRTRPNLAIPAEGFLPETSEEAKALNAELKAEEDYREFVFSSVPYIDHILIPGGDPGSLEPEDLFAFSGRVAKILHKYHPNAGVWISAQVMKNDESFKLRFYDQVVRRPAWLTGVCHAPWVSHVMRECRERTPIDLPIRNYPDICHAICCQYPYHDLDTVWAVTAGREFYNPRPRWHRRMHELNYDYNIGSLCYSEGIADDPSKIVWLDAEWDRAIPAAKSLRDFASMYISPDHAEALASVIADFENIFDGPAAQNKAVKRVYTAMRELKKTLEGEKYMPGFGADSYRFYMPLLMSAFLLHAQKRAVRDTAVFEKALSEFGLGGTSAEIAERMISDLEAVNETPDKALYNEIWELSDVCWDKIYWKVSERKHHSPHYERGGYVETIDLPLCDSFWLKARLEKMSLLPSEEERIAYLEKTVNRTNAGPGGRYINFGDPEAMRFIEMEKQWWDEPEAITIPRIEHSAGMWGPHKLGKKDTDKVTLNRVSSILGYYNAKVKIKIDGLVPSAEYELRIVFPDRFDWHGQLDIPAFILCNGERLELKGCLEGDEWVYVYGVPSGAVDGNGILRIVIDKETGPRGSGATELWLIKK
ncbi:MAG: hypothetical protein IKM29_06475 [Clostridia bacterium]|nr:hypothetical protein [Clostridia bacterium]